MKVKFDVDEEGRSTMVYLSDDGKHSCDAVYMTNGLTLPIEQLESRIERAKEAEKNYLENFLTNN